MESPTNSFGTQNLNWLNSTDQPSTNYSAEQRYHTSRKEDSSAYSSNGNHPSLSKTYAPSPSSLQYTDYSPQYLTVD